MDKVTKGLVDEPSEEGFAVYSTESEQYFDEEFNEVGTDAEAELYDTLEEAVTAIEDAGYDSSSLNEFEVHEIKRTITVKNKYKVGVKATLIIEKKGGK